MHEHLLLSELSLNTYIELLHTSSKCIYLPALNDAVSYMLVG